MSRTAGGVIGVIVAMLLTACAEPVSEEQVEENNRILAEIVERLDEPEGKYTKFSGSYVDDASTTQQVTFSVRCQACDAEKVIDRIVEAVWLSDVTPLSGGLGVYVHSPGGFVYGGFTVPDDEAELAERFGERPVESIPEDG